MISISLVGLLSVLVHLAAVLGDVDSSLIDSNICANRQDGVHVHPNDCRQYFHCLRANTYVFRCFKGFVFHPILRRCVFRTDCIPTSAVDDIAIKSQNLLVDTSETGEAIRRRPTNEEGVEEVQNDQIIVAPAEDKQLTALEKASVIKSDGKDKKVVTSIGTTKVKDTETTTPPDTIEFSSSTQQTYLVRVIFSRREPKRRPDAEEIKTTPVKLEATSVPRRKPEGEAVIDGGTVESKQQETDISIGEGSGDSFNGTDTQINSANITFIDELISNSSTVVSMIEDTGRNESAIIDLLIGGDNDTDISTISQETIDALNATDGVLEASTIITVNASALQELIDSGFNVTIIEDMKPVVENNTDVTEEPQNATNAQVIELDGTTLKEETEVVPVTITVSTPTEQVTTEAICNTTVICSCPNSDKAIEENQAVEKEIQKIEKAPLEAFTAELEVYCTDLRCFNGGMYVGLSNGHCGCVCPLGFNGDQCEHIVDQSNCRCANGGRCVSVGDQIYTCQCPLSYIGAQCQYSVEDIKPKFAALINLPHQSGNTWSRPLVPIDSNRFLLCKTNTCVNDGMCFRHVETGDTRCFCSNNYGGRFCEKKCENC